ncbi:ABC transporter permease [Frankia sp. CNm7]|uniref:ABC transporter permease n=1 Tax=Frankia nepalensis TaxID=1836974 RepID=A0A937RFW7_9ACTN|nr:ABC transporter permease [Frankia nepalensis]MBL7502107.1 ABC transporter permease [Frankia nepalensis]MBL7514766.1 ABC transporter permease [Frankia nepalensis]MBL7519145.1 ABC transporter permease [Frankia nepalensis]MBL7628129.1 ABC transporter permease [Frankia nepalensis]
MSTVEDAFGWLADGAHWSGGDGIPARLGEHLMLTGVSVGIAAALALPLGIWLGHRGRGGGLATNLSGALRAVPTFAVLVLLAIGPLGIGDRTTIVALVVFAVAPLVTNGYVGVREVDAGVREAARGMGMSGGQLLVRVELPLALHMIMVGVRLASVQVIATATIAALIGGGGLGRYVVDGLAQHDQPKVFAGAILVATLALVVDGLFLALTRLLAPGGARGARSRRR